MESIMSRLNSEEKDAISELQLRFRSTLSTKLSDDPTLFYRFLKARDFDVNKAEAMLRKHITWRKAFQVDSYPDTFKPMEVFQYISMKPIGMNKDGNKVMYMAAGKCELRDVFQTIKLNDYLKHWAWLAEKHLQTAEQQSIKTGKDLYQAILISDLEDCPISNVMYKTSADFMLQATSLLQDNYPERMRAMYIINAPVYFTILFSIMKKIMSNELLGKIQVFGKDGWKEALLKIIDVDVLPAFLGGNRTDPDGNPLCKTFVCHGGRFAAKYALTDEERYFKDTARVKKVQIRHKENFKIPVEVKECGSDIQWEFEIKHKDIGFALFYQKEELDLEELLPIMKFVTIDGTETGSFMAQSTGTYIIMFDNSHSWWSKKEVHYCVTVKRPEKI